MSGEKTTPTMDRPDMTRSNSARRSKTVSGRSGSTRRLALVVQFIGAVLVASSIIVGLFASHAGAAQLSNGTVTIRIAGSGASTGAVATNPLVHHQVIDVVVAPNSTLDQSSLEAAGFPSGAAQIKVLECADLNGDPANLPIKPTQCDPTTVQVVSYVAENGMVFVKHYKVYALPDVQELGPSNGTVCDDAENQCVLGIFTNQNDFTKPHIFSAPFQVTTTGTTTSAGASSSGTANPGSPSSNPSSSSPDGVSPNVSVPPAMLADTGGPSLWPWLLGVGCVLLVVGSTLRYLRRPAHHGGR
jgi:hypothetical protein